ncbi:MAG: D-tyrosyl-tRNA(Tyr) deacylase [Calditrichia bacterium]|nr:D-tyrosyl-tRNA(Tyr) deacylase [Calditrichia bacterium]
MRVVVQRVSSASVKVDEKEVGKIGIGLLLLIGIAETDTETEIEFVANKCSELRIFQDEDGRMNRSVLDIGGEILAISQFTLLGDTSKGRRPSFIKAANPEKAEKFYNIFNQALINKGLHVETGIFGAMMDVDLTNAGPVTLIVDSK